VGSFYQHFENKPELAAAVMRIEQDRLLATLEAVDFARPASIESALTSVLDGPGAGLYRAMREATEVEPVVAEVARYLGEASLVRLTDAIESARGPLQQRRGFALDARAVAWTFLALQREALGEMATAKGPSARSIASIVSHSVFARRAADDLTGGPLPGAYPASAKYPLAEMRRALSSGEMVLYYQPQVDIASGKVIGAEALLRWKHPELGLIPPLEFIPLAEGSGLIVEFTPWVIEEALRQARAWAAAGLNLGISVNVAMRNVRDPSFLVTLQRLLKAADVPAKTLTLEITEATTMLEPELTLPMLRDIRDIGVAVSVDDFGTGYSSLGYLSRFPIDELKIDKYFVMDVAQRGNRAIVRAVVQLAAAFGMRVVAEGVKDEGTWNAVRALSCNRAQGFYLSPPLPPNEMETWARRHNALS
jgi:EAL domain-containing protein (putative c-di-GMP-specific phosphodiesterase class I)/AcrR family transcriptional regulator